jgi:hypothetical protein
MKKKLDSEINESLKSILKDANGVLKTCQEIVGDDEFCLTGGLWRRYARDNPDALRYAIQKWYALDPIRRRSINQPGAWVFTVFRAAEKSFRISERKGVKRNETVKIKCN